MARPQISTAIELHAIGLLIVRGRGFDARCVVVVRSDDGNTARIRPGLALNDVILVSYDPDGAIPVSGTVVNPGSEASREFAFSAGDIEPGVCIVPGAHAENPLRVALIANAFYAQGSRIIRDQMVRNGPYFGKRVVQVLGDIYLRPAPSPLALPKIRRATRIELIRDVRLASLNRDEVPEWAVLCKLSGSGTKRRIEASRRRVQSFLERMQTWADVALVLSHAPAAQPTGWFAQDNYARGGESFTFDGGSYKHCYYSSLPGVIAFSRRNIRAYEVRHELCHALSSFNSGQVLDEYDLKPPYRDPEGNDVFAVNKKLELNDDFFAEYDGAEYPAKRLRVKGRTLYVPAVAAGKFCVMHRLQGHPQADALIGRFLVDRLTAKISRPF